MIVGMKRTASGSTMMQFSYAQKRLNGDGRTKYEMAIASGYAPSVARNAAEKIEETEGYQNAILVLAKGSHELASSILIEYERRGLTEFSNKDLNGALNAISSAWEKFDKKRGEGKMKDPDYNPLRAAVVQRANTIINNPPIVHATVVEAAASDQSQADAEMDAINELDL